jgi:aquaporin Z
MAAHWREYGAEALGLGLFMVAACALGALLGHPDSPVVRGLPDPFVRRALMGGAMGLTAILLIRSPWGQRSGAHLNPATTLTFWRLGKVEPRDAIGYAIAQVIGGLAGVGAAKAALGDLLGHPDVNYVATTPGRAGAGAAFAAEVAITFVLISVVLHVSNAPDLARHTPLFVGVLVAAYITVEAPISGMSMNPARSLASALPSGAWDALWIYFLAPPIGMLLAAEVHVWRRGVGAVHCAKLDHDNPRLCPFRCRYDELMAEKDRSASTDAGGHPSPSPATAPASSAPDVARHAVTGVHTP